MRRSTGLINGLGRKSMIDSVVLQLEDGQFEVKDDRLFDGKDVKQVRGKFSNTTAFCLKYAEEQKKKGRYFPRIQMPEVVRSRDGAVEKIKTLEIQVSLPKLVYGTNLFEIDGYALDKICNILVACLKELGIETQNAEIRRAVLKRVDFSKIIKIPSFFGNATQAINLLSKFNYKPRAEFSEKQYFSKQEGLTLKFWNKTQGYAIYDKFGEFVSNAHTLFEQNLVKALEEKNVKRHFLKFEFSLQRKQSMEALLRRHLKSKKTDFTLSEILLNQGLAKNILLEVYDRIFSNTHTTLLTLAEMKENELEGYLLSKNLSLKSHSLMFYLVNKTTKNGVAAVWEELRHRAKGGTYDRYKKEISLAMVELGELGGNTANLVRYLREQHEKFEFLTLPML